MLLQLPVYDGILITGVYVRKAGTALTPHNLSE